MDEEETNNENEKCLLHDQETGVDDGAPCEEEKEDAGLGGGDGGGGGGDGGGGGTSSSFEEVLDAMGSPGRYQILQCLMININLIPVVFINMSFVFIGLEPSFSCSPLNDTSLLPVGHPSSHYVTSSTNETMTSSSYHQQQVVSYEHSSCGIQITSNASSSLGTTGNDVTIDCPHGYVYAGGRDTSIVTEWDLVCDARGTAQLAQSVVAIGWFIGVLISSTLSDRYGRKTVLTVATVACSLFEVSCAFAPNLYVMIIFRFFSGLFASGNCSIAFVLGAELLVSRYREIYTFYFGVIWSSFSLVLSGVAYLFRDDGWRDLQMCLGLLCASGLLFSYFVDESTSWLYSKGHYQRATRILQNVCRINKVDFNKITPTWDRLCKRQEKSSQTRQEDDHIEMKNNADVKNYNLLDIFRVKQLRASALIGWIVSFTNNISFFGMYLSASTLAGNLYLNTVIMSLLEFPGCVWTLYVLRYKGRRFTVIFFMSLAAVCLLVSTVLGSTTIMTSQNPHVAGASTAFFLLGRLAMGNSYNGIYLYIPELFPTTHRSSGTGFCVTGASVGALLAPYLVPFHAVVQWGPGAFLVAFLVISVLLLLKLPETKGKQLASTIEHKSGDITSL